LGGWQTSRASVVPASADSASDREIVNSYEEPPAFKDISVEVKNGVVRLTGTLASGAQRLEAAMAARAIPSVRAVKDNLRLGTVTR
jgi:hypothetical protein